jgi:hypothetical protein
VQPADIAVELRPRTAWEAIDLGIAMLRRWWRPVFVPHAIVFGAATAIAAALGAWLGKPWVAMLLIWWLKPLYDRVVLHVLSHAVFGEPPRTRAVLGAWRHWLGSGLPGYLCVRWWPDMARSFNLAVRQLEGQRRRAARERLSLLGRRARGHAVWLTLVFMHFELVLYLSFSLVTTMLVPAKALEGRSFLDTLAVDASFWAEIAAYAAAVLVLEPFYVAGGFALYLNRRTLLEGWDLEVALRRIAEKHAIAALLAISLFGVFASNTAFAQKDPKREIAEVLKAPEFPHERDTMRWMPRNVNPQTPAEPPNLRIGYWAAMILRVLLWALVAAAIVFLLWKLWRNLPRLAWRRQRDEYRPPPSLFGMELAPQTLPPDVAASALGLAREGKLREALALLYRGALSQLVHRWGVRLLASHTEAEVLSLAPFEAKKYLEKLIDAWRACAYARRPPDEQSVEALAEGYRTL